jgi:hypothetical protein
MAADRLALAHAIEDAGIARDKAERVASAIFDAINDNVPTKADLFAVRSDVTAAIAATRRDLTAAIAATRLDLTAAIGPEGPSARKRTVRNENTDDIPTISTRRRRFCSGVGINCQFIACNHGMQWITFFPQSPTRHGRCLPHGSGDCGKKRIELSRGPPARTMGIV